MDIEERITLSEAQREVVAKRIRRAQSWFDRIQEIQDSDKGSFATRSERNLALVGGRYWSKAKPDEEVSSVNYLMTSLLVKQAIVTAGDTHFITTSRQEQFRQLQPVAEGLLNDLWDSLDFDGECDKTNWDSMVHPRGGVVEIGWHYKDTNIERLGRRPEELAIAEADLKANPAASGPLPPEVLMGMGSQIGPVPEELLQSSAQEAVWSNEPEIDEPFVERFDPRNLLVDPECTSPLLKECQYAFRHKWALLEQVKSNPAYRNTASLKGKSYTFDPERRRSISPADVESDDIKYTEIYDGYTYLTVGGEEERYHIVFSLEISKELLCEPPPYPYFRGANPYPFEIMPGFQPDLDILECLPDAEKARDLQVLHDLALTQLEWARAHSPNVLIVPTGTFAGEEGERTRQRIVSGHENAILEVDPAFIGSVQWMRRPELHADAYEALNDTPNRIMDIIGVSEFQSNMLPGKQMTATEAGQLATQGATRQESEVERYYDFIERVAYKVLTLTQQFQTRDRPFGFTTPAGEQQFGTANMQSLRGPGLEAGSLQEPGIQFAIAIDISKKQPKNEFLERQNATEVLKTVAPFAGMPDPRLPVRPMVNMPRVLRAVLEKFDMPDLDEMIPPDPSPQEVQQFMMMQQQQAQEQQARMQQEQETGRFADEGRARFEGENREADRQTRLMIEQMRMAGRRGPPVS